VNDFTPIDAIAPEMMVWCPVIKNSLCRTGASPAAKANVCDVREIGDL
jgi:hypothetical protein